MRLWHIDLIPYLPKSQLLGQWRELNSIFKKQDKHILINYIYDYPREYLYFYADAVIDEINKRNININSYTNFNKFFQILDEDNIGCIGRCKFAEHNNEYLLICFINLYEKYIRGQKDFDKATFNKLYDFVNTKFDLKSLGIEK